MPHDGHEHGSHPTQPDQDGPLTHWQIMEIAVRELLTEKGVTTSAEIASQVAKMDARSPAGGAKVVARAWVDPDFKARLLADGSSACTELGLRNGRAEAGGRGEHCGSP